MPRRDWDLALVALLAVVALAGSFVGLAPGPIASLPIVILLLVLPGYAITAALFPPGRIGAVGRLLLSLGLSLALTALSGTILGSPHGLNAIAVTAGFVGVTLLASTIALVRRRTTTGVRRRAMPNRQQFVLLGIALLITIAAFAIERSGDQSTVTSGATQLALVQLTKAQPYTFSVTLQNSDVHAAHFRLQLRAGQAVLQEWTAVEIAPGATWKTEMTLTATQSEQVPLEALVYRAEEPNTILLHAVLHVRS